MNLFFRLKCADMVLDHQEASNEMDESVRVKVREALLKKHHHQNEKKKNLIPMVRSIAEGARKQSEPHLTGGRHYNSCFNRFKGCLYIWHQ